VFLVNEILASHNQSLHDTYPVAFEISANLPEGCSAAPAPFVFSVDLDNDIAK